MLNNLFRIKSGPELNLFHPPGLYQSETFRATFYAYLTRRGPSLPFEIQGYPAYGLRPKHIVDNRSFYGLETHEQELAVIDKARGLHDVLDWLREHLVNTHGWAKEFYWIDHTPRNALAATEVLRFFPKSRFVHLVRDGRDAITSQYRRFSNARFTEAPKIQCFELAWALWAYLESHALQAAQEPGYLRVYYEDLVSDPVTQINRVLKHLGFESIDQERLDTKAPTSPEDFDFRQGDRASGWLSSPFSAVNSKSIGRWKKEPLPAAWEELQERPLRFPGLPETSLKKILIHHHYDI